MENKVLFVGLVCVDIVAESAGFPIEDTDQRIAEFCRRRGGNASNSSSVAAQLGLHTEFLGTLGQCAELSFIQEDFTSHSVLFENCPVLPGQEFSTSVVIVNQENGSRTILHHPKKLPELHISALKSLDLQKYSWIHFEGRSDNVNHIKEMISFIRQSSPTIKISVEIEKVRPILKELVPLGDVLFVSKDFSVFSGYQSMEKAVEGFLDLVKPGTVVVCPWGADGAAAGRNGKIYLQVCFASGANC